MFSKFKPHHIQVKPIHLPIERLKRYKIKNNIIEADAFEASEELLIFDQAYVKFANKLIGIVLLIGGLFIITHGGISKFMKEETIFDIIAIIMLLSALFLLIVGFKANSKEKRLLLNRKEGIITYPGPFLEKPLTGSFKDLKVIVAASAGDDMPHREYLKIINTFRPKRISLPVTISYDDPYEAWSFFVWYMDKNRPLPLGTAFDPYRKKDYERRKAERFPKPLYSSSIPTPEATPEQQAERERFWTDGFGKMKFLPASIEKIPINFNEQVTVQQNPYEPGYREFDKFDKPYYLTITDAVLEQPLVKIKKIKTKNTLKFNRLTGTLFYTSEISSVVLKTSFSSVKIGYCIDAQRNDYIIIFFETEDGPKQAMDMEFLKDHPFNDVNEEWSFYIWYMDRNRPLPPGKAFDAYRDKDFERRKAEGFPLPLYPSKVPTPEATDIQQKERDKYWRDLDHINSF